MPLAVRLKQRFEKMEKEWLADIFKILCISRAMLVLDHKETGKRFHKSCGVDSN